MPTRSPQLPDSSTDVSEAAPEFPLTLEAAEQQLAALVAPMARVGRRVFDVVRLVNAAAMTLSGAGLVLASPVWAALCAVNIAAAPVLLAMKKRRFMAKFGTQWTAAADVHARSLPGRVPADTLEVADRYLKTLASAHGKAQAWLYVAPCQGPEKKCTVLCSAAATWASGGQVMIILGEHTAQIPSVAAVALAHETCHHAGVTSRALRTIHHARTTVAWGYSAAAAAGAVAGGWPAAITAAVAFHVTTLLVLWGVETTCDRHATGDEGLPTALDGYDYMTTRLAVYRAQSTKSRPRRMISHVLAWTAGPLHPPVKLRRTLTVMLHVDRPDRQQR